LAPGLTGSVNGATKGSICKGKLQFRDLVSWGPVNTVKMEDPMERIREQKHALDI